MEGTLNRIRTFLQPVLAIFRKDMKMIAKNPVAVIITLGVCILPALYAWYIVEANWDPYSNSGNIKVAVANNDAGAESAYTGRIDVGQQVVDSLKDDHELGWEFVSEEEALDGVRSGRYFAAIVLPEDFSEDFISVFSGHFTKPHIDYYPNEKLSGSGTKITDTGADAVETAINEAFVSTVASKLVDISKEAGVQLEDHEKVAAGGLSQGVSSAKDAMEQNEELTQALIPTIDDSIASAKSAEAIVSSIKADLPGAENDMESASEQIRTTREKLDSLSNRLAADVTDASLMLAGAATDANISAARISGQVAKAKSMVDASSAEAERAIANNDVLLDSLRGSQAAQVTGIDVVIADIEAQNSSLESTVASLKTLSDDLGSSIDQTGTATQEVIDAASDAAASLASTAREFQTQTLPSIDSSLDSFASALSMLQAALASLDPVLNDASSMLGQLTASLERAKTSCSDASGFLGLIEDDLDDTLTDLHALQSSSTFADVRMLTASDPEKVGSFMASPVTLNTITVFSVSTYGSGVTPFFSNVAFWVCGLVLCAIFRQRVEPKGLPRFNRLQAYLGRWLTWTCVSIIQGLVIGIGDLCLGIQCESPPAFLATCVLSSFAYVNLIYALAYTAKHVGKALAVVLLIMQIPGSSGMFPIQTMPDFFQAINPLLPFTYSITALRETIGGFYGLHYLECMLMLAFVFVPIGFLIGLFGVKFGYNMNMLVDKKLAQTHLFVSDTVQSTSDDGKPWFEASPAIHALLETGRYRKKIVERALAFDRSYPKLRNMGWAMLVAIPSLMFIVFVVLHAFQIELSTDSKLSILCLFILFILVVTAYLMVINYLNASIEYKIKAMGGLSIAKEEGAGDRAAFPSHERDGRPSKPYSAAKPGNDAEGDGRHG